MNEDKTAVFIGSMYGHGTGYAGAVYSRKGLCPTLTTMQGEGREPNILLVTKVEPDEKYTSKT